MCMYLNKVAILAGLIADSRLSFMFNMGFVGLSLNLQCPQSSILIVKHVFHIMSSCYFRLTWSIAPGINPGEPGPYVCAEPCHPHFVDCKLLPIQLLPAFSLHPNLACVHSW